MICEHVQTQITNVHTLWNHWAGCRLKKVTILALTSAHRWKKPTRWLKWERSDIHRDERGLKACLNRVRVSGLASREIIRDTMTRNIWSHVGNSMYSYAEKQRDQRAPDWLTNHRRHQQPAHAASYKQLAVQKRSTTSHIEVMTKTYRSQNNLSLRLN